MVDSVSSNSQSVNQYDDGKRASKLQQSRSKRYTGPIPIVVLSNLKDAVAIGVANSVANAVMNVLEESRRLKIAEEQFEISQKQHAVDFAINGQNGVANCGHANSEAELDQIYQSKIDSLKKKLQDSGYRYGANITMQGSYPNTNGTSISSQISTYVTTSYEDKVANLKKQGYEETSKDKFVLDKDEPKHTAKLKIEGYDAVTVQNEIIDNRTDENKNYDAVKGAKLGKAAGEPVLRDDNTLVQSYENGTVVETAYDNPDNPQVTIVTTRYPDGSISRKTESDVPVYFGIGEEGSENYVEAILEKGTITEQFAPDGSLVYRKTKS